METIVEFFLAHFPDDEPLLISEDFQAVKDAWKEAVEELPALKIFVRRTEIKDVTPSQPKKDFVEFLSTFPGLEDETKNPFVEFANIHANMKSL